MARNIESKNVKDIDGGQTVAKYPHGATFTGISEQIIALRHPRWRSENDGLVRENDILESPYFHPKSHEDNDSMNKSQQTAERVLKQIKQWDLSDNRLGIEIEGTLYNLAGDLIPKYDGKNFTAENDEHPELVDSMIEVATGKTSVGQYPSYPIETAQSLAQALSEAIKIADIRDGLFVTASVPEGGNSEQVRLTEHPYIKKFGSIPLEALPWKDEIPQETMDIYNKAKISPLVPIHATHVHTSNPQLEGSQFLDQRIAYAKGILRLTQMEKVANFSLFSTRDYLGEHMPGVKDVRAIARRGRRGAMDSDIPGNAHEFFEKARHAVADGDIHSFSRYPYKGQHDRLRIKEFGTVEGIDGAANPDLRIILAKTYFDQMKDVLAYQALLETKGDESEVIPYLQYKYGYLFEIIPTMKGKDSSFQQDLEFNQHGFDGNNKARSYREQMTDVRKLVRQIGREFPTFELQARIVDHVFKKVSEPVTEEVYLDTYMDIASGMKSGIVTDNKYPAIIDNIHAQAEGTRRQTETLLQIRDDEDLLAFFGIKSKDSVTIYSQK